MHFLLFFAIALALIALAGLAVHCYLKRRVDWARAMATAERFRVGSFQEAALPNKQVAAALFQAIEEHAPDRRLAALASAKRAETLMTDVPLEDRRGTEALQPTDDLADLIARIERQRPPTTAASAPITIIRDAGSQNVHDHGVTAGIAHSLDMLQATAHEHPPDAPDTRVPVREAVLTSERLTAQQKSDALTVLDSISHHPHSNPGLRSELQALTLVWSRARARPEIRDLLLLQLADSVMHPGGGVVCSTGKIARIVGALDGAYDWRSMRPMWAVREELATLAAQTRDAGHGADEFQRAVRKQYVDQLGFSDAILAPIVAQLSQGFE